MVNKNITINVTGKKQLKIGVSGEYARFGIANIVETGMHNYTCDYTKTVTVQEDGLLTYTCKDCGYKYTEKVDARAYCTKYILPYQMNDIRLVDENEGSDQALTVMGKKYYHAIASSQCYSNAKVFYNLNQSYSKVSFSVGHIDNLEMGRGAKLSIYKDNIQMGPYDLTPTMQNIDYDISMTGITQLRIEIEGNYARYAIFDLEATPNITLTVKKLKMGKSIM